MLIHANYRPVSAAVTYILYLKKKNEMQIGTSFDIPYRLKGAQPMAWTDL